MEAETEERLAERVQDYRQELAALVDMPERQYRVDHLRLEIAELERELERRREVALRGWEAGS